MGTPRPAPTGTGARLHTVGPVAATARLRIYQGAGKPQEARLLASPFVVGRGGGCDLVLSDPEVSRSHLVFEVVAGHWTVTDDVTENGTYVNGDLLVGAYRLSHGDQVRLGNSYLRFDWPLGRGAADAEPLEDDTVKSPTLTELRRRDSARPLVVDRDGSVQRVLASLEESETPTPEPLPRTRRSPIAPAASPPRGDRGPAARSRTLQVDPDPLARRDTEPEVPALGTRPPPLPALSQPATLQPAPLQPAPSQPAPPQPGARAAAHETPRPRPPEELPVALAPRYISQAISRPRERPSSIAIERTTRADAAPSRARRRAWVPAAIAAGAVALAAAVTVPLLSSPDGPAPAGAAPRSAVAASEPSPEAPEEAAAAATEGPTLVVERPELELEPESEPESASETASTEESPSAAELAPDVQPSSRRGAPAAAGSESPARGRDSGSVARQALARAKRAYEKGDLDWARKILRDAIDRVPAKDVDDLDDKIVRLGKLKNLLAIAARSERSDPLVSLRAMEKALREDAALGGSRRNAIRRQLADMAAVAARRFIARDDRDSAREAVAVAKRHGAGKRVDSVARALERR